MNDSVKKVVEVPAVKRKKHSRFAQAARRFSKNKLAMVGLVIIACMILMAICADLIVPYAVSIKIDILNKAQAPSTAHIFGTDELGRDIFARVIHGSRVSLAVGIIAVSASLLIGGTLGAVAGFYGKGIENVTMRFSDILQAVPQLMLAITIVSSFGQSLLVLMVAVSISSIPAYIRTVRASTLTIKNMEYIEAARAVGAKNYQIIFHHVINNCLAPIIVQATLRVAAAILSISSMSFLGLGVKAPMPEWGSIMSGGRSLLRDAPHITIIPGIFIMLTILALNMMGDGLRDALDPKLKN